MRRSLEEIATPDAVVDREGSIPSLTALRAFVTAAQYRNFSRAADELGITQSGVSRAIRSIEVEAGVKLFERTGHGLVLTEAGVDFREEVASLLLELQAATLRLSTYNARSETLHISVLPSLGGRWLAPRLHGFLKKNPSLDITVSGHHGTVDLDSGTYDAAIWYGNEAWPGTLSEFLMDEYLVPLCSPSLLPDGAKPHPGLLEGMSLIQHIHRPTAWREWFKACGLEHATPQRGPRFAEYQMGIEAAKSGLGAILMPAFMVSSEIAEGDLVAMHGTAMRSPWRYHLIYPKSKRSKPVVQKFKAWIRREARQTGKNIGFAKADLNTSLV